MQVVKVRILDKEYQIACPPEEHPSLQTAAQYLNERMSELRGRGNVIGSDRLAVITALNLANELLRLRDVEAAYDDLDAKLGALQGQVASALAD